MLSLLHLCYYDILKNYHRYKGMEKEIDNRIPIRDKEYLLALKDINEGERIVIRPSFIDRRMLRAIFKNYNKVYRINGYPHRIDTYSFARILKPIVKDFSENDLELCKLMISKNEDIFQYFPLSIRDNEEICVLAAKRNYQMFRYISTRLRHDYKFCIEVILSLDTTMYCKIVFILVDIPMEIRDNEEFCYTLINVNPLYIGIASPRLLNTKKFVMPVIKLYPLTYMNISDI